MNQAETEVVVQGPKDAFTELMSVNVVLTRRRIRDTRLKVKRKKVGRRSKTDVALLYMEDLVRPELLQKIERQVDRLDLDHLPDSGYAEQLLEKRQYSPFPQLQMTERPDKTSSALLEGRVALLPDNTPYAILLPATLNTFFQAAEDYYDRWEIMSFIRLIRFVAAFLTVTLPGLYIAFAVYHPELLPTALALKVAATRETIPFSVIGEVLIMEIAFELLREGGIRLPSPVSSTIGIVGGIIIGSAAVDAGIVSPTVVIVSALTGICSFVIPNVSIVSGLRISKYVVIFFAAVFGLFGVWAALLLLLAHLASLTSYGIPYLYPFCSSSVNDDMDWEDSIFRLPLSEMKRRPIFTRPDVRRRKDVCGESENFYQTAANAVITGLLWHCCPFSSGGAGRDKRQRVLFCGFAWRLGGVGCLPSADSSRKAHAQWYGGRLVPERLRQCYRDNPFAWLGRKAFA